MSPESATERALAQLLADLVGHERVPATSDFFHDLGANSLVMAHFCARIRKRPDLPSISIKDVYSHSTIRKLAAAMAEAGSTSPATANGAIDVTPVPAARAGSGLYGLCGTLQLVIFLAYGAAASWTAYLGYNWISAATGVLDIYLRSLACGGVAFTGLCLLPVLAKWVLVGRWKAQEFPVWGLSYLRFWIVKSLIHSSPMILLVGNPVYVWYLRALGARIGRNVTILSRSVPVCTDLLTIGAGTVIRKESFFLCYRAYDARIQTGRVTLGRNTFVGEKTVLDIDTEIADGAQLGHTSSLHRHQSVPARQRWHGSPAQRSDVDYVRVPPVRCGRLRRTLFAAGALLQLLLLSLPIVIGGAAVLLEQAPALDGLVAGGGEPVTSPLLCLDALALSGVFALGFLVLGLLGVFAAPRLLRLFIEPNRTYPLYGFHYSVHRVITRLTNIKFFKWLLGDSSYIVPYLKGLGYDLSRVEQTGSNFGTVVRHETPYLSSVGTGTMVADGLSVINADFSSTSFRVVRARIGAYNFIGNSVAYPSEGRTGENCLLATKVMVPLDGPVRQGVGLLGSPCFEIPRSVERDTRFDHLRAGDELRRRLAAKNRYNLRTVALYLLVRWLQAFVVGWLALAAFDTEGLVGHVLLSVYLPAVLCFTAGYYIVLERALAGFRPLQPQLCSIYQPYFWWHERFWKVPATYLTVFNGTPYKNLIWRLLGVRIGRRVFDDGCSVSERTLTTIGSECTLNAGSGVQCHSQEDGTFKSDRSRLGDRCTIGTGALVHYGVTMEEHAVLAPDSFLMKGEEVPAHATWGGNPAAEIRSPRCRPVADDPRVAGAADR